MLYSNFSLKFHRAVAAALVAVLSWLWVQPSFALPTNNNFHKYELKQYFGVLTKKVTDRITRSERASSDAFNVLKAAYLKKYPQPVSFDSEDFLSGDRTHIEFVDKMIHILNEADQSLHGQQNPKSFQEQSVDNLIAAIANDQEFSDHILNSSKPQNSAALAICAGSALFDPEPFSKVCLAGATLLIGGFLILPKIMETCSAMARDAQELHAIRTQQDSVVRSSTVLANVLRPIPGMDDYLNGNIPANANVQRALDLLGITLLARGGRWHSDPNAPSKTRIQASSAKLPRNDDDDDDEDKNLHNTNSLLKAMNRKLRSIDSHLGYLRLSVIIMFLVFILRGRCNSSK